VPERGKQAQLDGPLLLAVPKGKPRGPDALGEAVNANGLACGALKNAGLDALSQGYDRLSRRSACLRSALWSTDSSDPNRTRDGWFP
jgi:hypothetical protein